MQRQFSNRGEALPEVTAARVLARRKTHSDAAFAARASARLTPGQWFAHPVQTIHPPKKKAE